MLRGRTTPPLLHPLPLSCHIPPTIAHIRAATRYASNSAPGTDGLPYEVWRILGELALEVLGLALRDLADDDFEELLQRAYCDAGAVYLVKRLQEKATASKRLAESSASATTKSRGQSMLGSRRRLW